MDEQKRFIAITLILTFAYGLVAGVVLYLATGRPLMFVGAVMGATLAVIGAGIIVWRSYR
jgi:hypothetical protein